MNPQYPTQGRHLDDADLIRYIDAEGQGDESRQWEEHLVGCGRCRSEAETLRTRSDAVAYWLDAAEFEAGPGMSAAPPALAGPELAATRPAPTSLQPRGHNSAVGAGVPWLKAAVITLLLAAPLAAIPPVRAWIADRVAVVLSDEPAATGAVDGPARAAVHTSVIRFVPAPGAFLVTIDAPQAEGWLHLTRAPGSEAILAVRGPSPRPEPVVSASTLRIENSAEMTASYALALPPEVDLVYVDVAGARLQLDAGDLTRSTRIPLRPEGARR
jgi:hypothetical protein